MTTEQDNTIYVDPDEFWDDPSGLFKYARRLTPLTKAIEKLAESQPDRRYRWFDYDD